MNKHRLEEQIRLYTEAMDSMASPIEELLPDELREEAGARGGRVEITIPLGPPRRTARPAWLYGLAAALAVIVLAIPIWLWVSDDQPDVADTTPTTVTPPTLPESFDLADYPLVFDGETQSLSGTGWEPNQEVAASLDTAGFVEVRAAIADDQGRFAMPPFEQCCADVTVLTVTQGDREITARIDRGIRVNLFGAERDVLTIAYGGGFDVQLVVESEGEIYTATVTPDSDWWSLDLTDEIDVSLGATAAGVLVRDGVAFVAEAESEQTEAEVIVDLRSLAFEGQGFLPEFPFELSINGRLLADDLLTDRGGHFYLEAAQDGNGFKPGDTIEFSYLGERYEATVPVLTFDSLDSSGRAVGTALGVDELSDVVVHIRSADGSRREEVANGVPISDGVWTVELGPLADGDVVEDGGTMGRSSIFGFVVPLRIDPIQNPENGHYYEAVTVFGGISWGDAEAAARSRSFNGVQGHLLTITSDAESDFVVVNFPLAMVSGPSRETFWLGSSQPLGSVEPAGGWEWVTGESFAYQNWAPQEPNDHDSPEQCLNFSSDALGTGYWNDQPCDALGSGYIVEYDTSG